MEFVKIVVMQMLLHVEVLIQMYVQMVISLQQVNVQHVLMEFQLVLD
jgi:hypothetical protein